MVKYGPEKWLYLVLIGVSIVFLLPFYGQIGSISLNDDWTQIFAFQSFLADSLLSGELPHRSHMLGSGFPIIGHPEYPIISPFTLIVLVFGSVIGVKINVGLVFITGLYGMWLLCRRTLGLSLTASSYALLTLAVSGWFPAILASGNYPQIYYLWFPLLAYLVLDDSPFDGRIVIASILGTTMLLDGHLNSISCFLVLGIWALLRGKKQFIRFIVSMVSTAGLAAYKLIPVASLLRIEDRSINDYTIIENARLSWSSFLGWSPTVDGFSLGPVPWIIAIVGIALWRKNWRLWILVTITLCLWAGSNSPIDLFFLLNKLPIFGSMDAPSKYFVFFVGFSTILIGAIALNSIPTRNKSKYVQWAVIALTVIPCFISHQPTITDIFSVDDPAQQKRKYVQIDTPYFLDGVWSGKDNVRPDLYVYYKQGVAISRWEDNFKLPAAAIPSWYVANNGTINKNSAYRGEAWISNGKGEVELEEITPNSLRIKADLAIRSTVEINQRFDSAWSCDAGEISAKDRKLSLSLAAGPHIVSCSYTSKPLVWGLLISAFTLMTLTGLLWRRRTVQASLG